MIRGLTIKYCSHKKKTRADEEQKLELELTDLYLGEGVKINEGEIIRVEGELKKIREEKNKGMIIRTKLKCHMSIEQPQED